MKPKVYWLLLIASVAILCLSGWTGYARKQNPSTSSRVIWEYKTLQGNLALREDQLNDMGMHGWELIRFDDGERGNGSFQGTYYFKRPK